MRKLYIFFSLFLVSIIAIGFFNYEKIKGILPVVLPAKDDIAQIIEDNQKNNTGNEVGGLMSDLPLKLPANFEVSIFAKDLGPARVMHWGPSGKMLVSVPKDGRVLALVDADFDGVAESTKVVIDGLNNPHGLASRCVFERTDTGNEKCQLYIAEEDQVAEYDYDISDDQALNKKKLFDLPADGGHYTRTIMFMPYPDDQKMLVSVGSSCNVCNEEDDRRAKVLEYDFATGKLEEFAKGLRNSVFMAIHPVSGDIWATEMGRDNLGNDTPPDEINILKKGANYGWPVCYGKNLHDTDFDKNTYIRNPCLEPYEVASYIDIPAHSAPLGLAFFPEEGWGEEYWYNALVAYHGSWNSTVPKGYKIVRYKLDQNGKYIGEEDFMTGFLPKDTSTKQAYGRPVDILIQPGGTIYVSDDKAGVIYKINYTGN